MEPAFDDVCGAASPRHVITSTTRDLRIDTRAGYSDDSSLSCGDTTPGADAFVALDAAAGDRWHIHLTVEAPEDRDPVLFLADAGECAGTGCTLVSNECSGVVDQHMGFVAPSSGRWYVGIDDVAPGGGVYLLSAYRLVCGDGTRTHGEACDDGNRSSGDGCDADCRIELSELRTMEAENNDDRIESNAIVLPASSQLTITGVIGGPGSCTYPDRFAVSVPAGGGVDVVALRADGTACTSGSLTPYDLALENAAGELIVDGMRDPSGCATVRASSLPAGEYFVRVQLPTATTTGVDYRLRVRVVP